MTACQETRIRGRRFLISETLGCFDFVWERLRNTGKRKKGKRTCREHASGFHGHFYLRKAESRSNEFIFLSRITKMRRILWEREISKFCIILLCCPFDLSVCLPAEQPIRYTLSTGDVKTRDTGTPFNFEQNRVSIYIYFNIDIHYIYLTMINDSLDAFLRHVGT